MTDSEIFLWGVLGSVAIDVIAVVKIYEAQEITFPARYSRVWYYVIRLMLALIGGGLAVAYGIDKAILAVNVGASAPLILTALSQGVTGVTPKPGAGTIEN